MHVNMEDQWLYREGKRDGRPYMASIRLPFDPARWREFDHHIAVAVTYGPHWRTGLPKPRELTRLQDLEDRMIAHLEGHGVLVATETSDATRTIHLLVRGGGPIVESFRERERRGKEKGVAVTVARDPAWEGLAHLMPDAARAA
jgi:hypothetical protein